jgi:hypothetical protein
LIGHLGPYHYNESCYQQWIYDLAWSFKTLDVCYIMDLFRCKIDMYSCRVCSAFKYRRPGNPIAFRFRVI